MQIHIRGVYASTYYSEALYHEKQNFKSIILNFMNSILPSIFVSSKGKNLGKINMLKGEITALTSNLRELQKQINIEQLSWSSESSQNQPQITAIHDELTLMKNLCKELSEYLEAEQDTEMAILLSKKEFFNKLIKIMDAIIEFQKKIDRLWTSGSQKIVESMCYILMLAIIACVPIATVPITGLFYIIDVPGKVKSQVSPEKLTSIVDSWTSEQKELQKKMQEIQTSKIGEQQYQKAKIIVEISKILDYSPLAIAAFKFSMSDFNHLHSMLNDKDEQQQKRVLEGFKQFLKECEILPQDKEGVAKIVDELQATIISMLKKIGAQAIDIKDYMKKDFHEIKENLSKACTPGISWYDKLVFISDAARALFHIKETTMTIAGTVTKGLAEGRKLAKSPNQKPGQIFQQSLVGQICALPATLSNFSRPQLTTPHKSPLTNNKSHAAKYANSKSSSTDIRYKSP